MRRVFHPETNGVKSTSLNGCSAVAHSLHHLTHGISTRRTFHPAKTGLGRWQGPSRTRAITQLWRTVGTEAAGTASVEIKVASN